MNRPGDSTDTAIGLRATPDRSAWHASDTILDNWSKREWRDGVQVESLADLDSLCVRTENSTYEIMILSGPNVSGVTASRWRALRIWILSAFARRTAPTKS